MYLLIVFTCHREISLVTHTTPEPTLLSWGGWHCEKNSFHLRPHCQTRSNRAYQATQTPLSSDSLMLPFDTQVCHECQICLRLHRILEVILEMAFSALCTQIWKLNRISMSIINKIGWKCIWCCHRVQRCLMAAYSGGKLCSGAWKHGQDSHVGMSSLW